MTHSLGATDRAKLLAIMSPDPEADEAAPRRLVAPSILKVRKTPL
jgi:hypothetical protein